MTREEFIELLQEQAKPIDFDQLAADGVLVKSKRGGYELMDRTRLPRHVSRKVTAISFDRDTKKNRISGLKETTQRTRLHFRKGDEARAVKLLRKLGAQVES